MGRFTPAARQGVGLLIGIAGATGSGKTLSALRVARGLAGGDDAKIAFIDTESGRALHYAPSPGEPQGPETFRFAHAPLTAPFTPERYLELIREADAADFSVIVIDSFSHVWAGEGGLQDMHDEAVNAAVSRARARAESNNWKFDEDRERDRASVGAWNEPKTRHKRMVSALLQCRAHLVICMRAEDKLRMETVTEQGRGGKEYTKTQITPADKLPPSERWTPICEKRFPYELITSLVLSPDNPGVPIPLKLQAQHRPFVPLDRPLDEGVGERLAQWARGAKPAGPTPQRAPAPHADETVDPDAPCRLPLAADADDQAMSKWAGVLRELMKDASSPGLAATWLELNIADANRIRARSKKLDAWMRDPLPADLREPNADDAPHGLMNPQDASPNPSPAGGASSAAERSM